jgi:putative sterol carrier protein
MKSASAAFFDELGRHGHEPLLERVSATVRFDIGDGASVDHRLLRIDRGDITVTTDDVPADCTVIVDAVLFDEITGGRTGAMAAFLRGALIIEGDPQVLVLVQRLFPGHPRRTGSTAGTSPSATEGSPQ